MHEPDPLYYQFQHEGWIRPLDAEDAAHWRNLKRELGLAEDATYQVVVNEIRTWRTWAAAVQKVLLAPIEEADGGA